METKKKDAWEKISDEFNSLGLSETVRTSKILKTKYESIKRNIKKKRANNKCELYKTGGGVANTLSYTEYEKKLMSIMIENIDGIGSINDSDNGKFII